VSFDFVFGYMRELKQVDWASVNTRFAALEKEGRQHLAEAGIRDGVTAGCSADMRYLSQRYEVNVALPAGALGPELLDRLHDAFYAAYRQHYGREIREVPVETVSWRLTVSGPAPHLAVTWPSQGRTDANPVPKARRPVVFAGFDAPVDCPVYERGGFRWAPRSQARRSSRIMNPRPSSRPSTRRGRRPAHARDLAGRITHAGERVPDARRHHAHHVVECLTIVDEAQVTLLRTASRIVTEAWDFSCAVRHQGRDGGAVGTAAGIPRLHGPGPA
jgi:hypothetical protein